MFIDLRHPVLVVSGHWNPTIFGLDWIAQNLFELEAGATVEVAQAFVPGRPSPALFISGVGIASSPERLEVYATDQTDEALASAEGIAFRALELLQHTPVFGVGANFTFADTDVDAVFADALMTAEGLEGKFRVTERSYQSAIALRDGVVLNLRRTVGAEGVQIAMNFHHTTQGAAAARAIMAGALVGNKPQALSIMSEFYKQDEFGIAKFGPVPVGEDQVES